MFVTKDSQIYFYRGKKKIFFYQARDPILTTKVGKLQIHPQKPPTHCLAIVTQSKYITIIYNVVLYEYKGHEKFKKEIQEMIAVRYKGIINVGIEEGSKNYIANFING